MRYYFSILMVLLLFSCKNKGNMEASTANTSTDPNMHAVKCLDFKQVTSYSYLYVSEGEETYWLAAPKLLDIKKNQTYYYVKGATMYNFESKDLDTVFESIVFVENLQLTAISDHQLLNTPAENHVANTKTAKEDIHIEPLEDGVSIENLFSHMKKYDGKKVKIKGVVVKYNPGILDANWLHIQDGTSHKDNNDLTITTQDEVNVGDTVIFEGTIKLNQDYGAGYSYELIMVSAVKVENI